MFCRHCGKQLSDSSKFCPKCGTAVMTINKEKSESTEVAAENVSDRITISGNVAAKAEPADKTAEEPISAENNVEVQTEKSEAAEVPAENVSDRIAISGNVASKSESADKTAEGPVFAEKKVKVPKEKKTVRTAFSVKKVVALASAAVIVGIMGLWILPEYLNSAIFNVLADNMSDPQTALIMRIASGSDDEDVLNEKLALARSYNKREEYGASAALLGKLAYNGVESAAEDIDDVLEANCKLLVENSQVTYAVSQAGIISDKNTSEKFKNNAYIAAAADSFEKNDLSDFEKYINKINVSYSYDEDTYNDILYKYAVTEYNSGDMTSAYDAFKKVSSYNDASEYLKKCSYSLGEESMNNQQYFSAIEYFEAADDYNDSADKVKECNYYIGVQYYNNDDMKSARNYFTKVQGYKDSDTYLKKIAQALKYDGWYIEAYTCNYVSDYYGDYYATSSFSTYDDFILYVYLYNRYGSTEYIDLKVTLTDSNGTTGVQYLNWMYDGSSDYVSFNYEYPYFVTANSGKFTVSIGDTGEILGTYYYTID